MGKSQSKEQISETCKRDPNYVYFALVGQSGIGKSSFVNAVRGVDEGDDLAASVDIVEKEQQPKEYTYPSHPLVSFCDLPGYGTPSYPDVETYWTKFELEKFDRFLIFISRVMQDDREIMQKIKTINKPFFLIYTKIDIAAETMMKLKEDRFREEELLPTIRNDILKWTKPCPKENIFIINNHEPRKWEFFQLIEAIMNVMPPPETDDDLTEQYMADARKHVKENGVSGIQEFLRKKLDGSKDVKIQFAITGNSGTGKSAFINAIRGLNDDDDGAAEVGIVETTKKPTEYKHPDNPKIWFMDLPGIGTPTFPDLKTYCEKVAFEDYDTFLIFTATRFTQNDLDLAKKVKSIGKSFFLIRTMIDLDCRHCKDDGLKNQIEIRHKCMKYVKDLISSEKEIFLISNYHTDKWDFDRLIEAISDALPVRQRECLTLSLSNVTRECLKRKAKLLKVQAVLVASLSGAASAIPAVGGMIDIVLIRGTIMAYYMQLGLSNTTSEERETLDKKYKEIIDKYNPGRVKEWASTTASVSKTLGLIIGVEEVSKFIPIIGIAISGSISFALTLKYLHSAVNDLEETAIAVWDNTAKRLIRDVADTNSKK